MKELDLHPAGSRKGNIKGARPPVLPPGPALGLGLEMKEMDPHPPGSRKDNMKGARPPWVFPTPRTSALHAAFPVCGRSARSTRVLCIGHGARCARPAAWDRVRRAPLSRPHARRQLQCVARLHPPLAAAGRAAPPRVPGAGAAVRAGDGCACSHPPQRRRRRRGCAQGLLAGRAQRRGRSGLRGSVPLGPGNKPQEAQSCSRARSGRLHGRDHGHQLSARTRSRCALLRPR
jgi:hypothetical protein